jgi:hypothetical protein
MPCEAPVTLQVSKKGKLATATAFAVNKKNKVTTEELLADLSDDENLAATANQASCSLTGGGLATSRPCRSIKKRRFFEESDSE